MLIESVCTGFDGRESCDIIPQRWKKDRGTLFAFNNFILSALSNSKELNYH